MINKANGDEKLWAMMHDGTLWDPLYTEKLKWSKQHMLLWLRQLLKAKLLTPMFPCFSLFWVGKEVGLQWHYFVAQATREELKIAL